MRNPVSTAGLCSCLLLIGCSSGSDDSGDASISVLLESEDVIIDGISAGDGGEEIRDGWSVSFERYIVAIGNVHLLPTAGDGRELHSEEVLAVDLTRLRPGGESLWEFEGVGEGTYDFGYETSGHDAERHESVNEEDFDELIGDDLTYIVSGTMVKEGGRSCPPTALATVPDDLTASGENSVGDPCYPAESISFSFGLAAEMAYGPCEIDGISGVSTTSGATTTVAITIHGDHLFFNGFPEGDEGGITRLAQWLADCDLDQDGTVTEEELRSIAPSDLPEIDDRFQLGGSPITPLDDMMTYLTAQAMTQGHFQGEGECALDGEAGHTH